MKERKLIICRGIQGSGKSTWAKQWCHEDPEHRVRFNNDDVRNMLGDYWVPSREKLVTEAKANMITFALIKGYDVVVDNMNLNPKEDAWIRTLCENIEKDTGIHVNIEYKDFWTPVEECILRDAARPNPIGEKIIKETWRRYRNFIISSDIKEMLKNKAEHVDGGRPVILVDMDATLCLNTYTMCTETYEAEEKNPLAAGFYRIELVRPVTSEEIEKDSSRWNGYKVGDKTNAFYSPEDVIAIAKEVCKARFLGNWKLKIVDYSGKDLDSEILISEL